MAKYPLSTGNSWLKLGERKIMTLYIAIQVICSHNTRIVQYQGQAWGRLQIDDYDYEYDYKQFLKGDFDYDYTKLEVADYDYSTIRVSWLRLWSTHHIPWLRLQLRLQCYDYCHDYNRWGSDYNKEDKLNANVNVNFRSQGEFLSEPGHHLEVLSVR